MNAPAFFPAGVVWSLWDMIELDAPNVTVALFNLGLLSERLVNGAQISRETDQPMVFQRRYIKALADSLNAIHNVAAKMSLPATEAQSDRCMLSLAELPHIGDEVHVDATKGAQLGHALNALSTTFTDEARGAAFFGVRTEFRKHLESDSALFGQPVDDVFPTAVEDIAEAAKCLALGRSTAVIFHLMRAMEIAVQRLASAVGVANVDKVWGNLLSDISNAIEAMPRGDRRDAWSAAHSHLYHVKQAWRNSTMHPKKTYTEEEAKTVFEAVGSFMRHLAPLVSP